jgi:hypothetical protein
MRSFVVLALALCIPCLAAAAGVYVTLKREVKALEGRLELAGGGSSAEAATGAAPSKVEPEWVSRLEARLAELEAKVKALPRGAGRPGAPGTAAGTGRHGGPGASAGFPRGKGPSGGANAAVPGREGAAPAEKEALEKKVKELESKLGKVQEKLEKRGGEEEDIKYASFAARLDMDEHQKAAAEEILRRGKTELLEHLRKPLPDGTVLIDELAETMYQASKNPEKQNKTGEAVFLRLFSEKVPGTQKTYIETIMAVQERMKTEVKTHLSDGQKKTYDEWSPDLTKVELPDDPFNKYIMDYMKRRKEQEGE